MDKIRTRFAPSPTGYLHVGSARTALFSYLFARHHNGVFVLRVEDTDVQRSTQEFTESILDNLEWLGLTHDEGPFFQSQRREDYQKHLDRLKEKGVIYYCTCTPDEVEQMRREAMAQGRPPKYDGKCRGRLTPPEGQNYVIRFAHPLSGKVMVNDAIRGVVSFDNKQLDDFIIVRTDGTFTYNFVVVADDIDMGITHIIRGEDHLNNTPKQVLLYKALGVEPPIFAHMPLTLGPDRTKLSKRHGATSVDAYREEGYLPQALVNFFVRLGWSHGDQEIFSMEELIEKFTIEGIGKSAGIFDKEKLSWLNSHYIKTVPIDYLAGISVPFFQKLGLAVQHDSTLEKRVLTLRERSKTLKEIAEFGAFYYREDFEMDEKAARKFLRPEVKNNLLEIAGTLETLPSFTEAVLEKAFADYLAEKGIKLGKIAQPVRVALTGKKVGPGLFEMMDALGQEATVKRLRKAADSIE